MRHLISLTQMIWIGLFIILTGMIGLYFGFIYGRKKEKSTYGLTNTSHIQQVIIKKMEDLKKKTNADFLGLAIYDIVLNEIRWRLAVGATNSRYKRIVIRVGKGIAGEVVQLNRTIKIENYPNDVLGDPIEYPILMVEHLHSVIAVPVSYRQRIYGVLLLGQRTGRKFTIEEEQKTKHTAEEIAFELENANVYSRIRDDATEAYDDNVKEHINDSIFVQYLLMQKNKIHHEDRGELEYEVLDQFILKIPESIQHALIKNMEEVLEVANQQEKDITKVSIARDESDLLIECKIYQSIPPAKEVFESVFQRMGEIGGAVFSYRETNFLHFIMQIPVWTYINPLK